MLIHRNESDCIFLLIFKYIVTSLACINNGDVHLICHSGPCELIEEKKTKTEISTYSMSIDDECHFLYIVHFTRIYRTQK